MPKRELRMKVYRLIYICDECCVGEMEVFERISVDFSGTINNHVCNNCQAKMQTENNEYYPRVEYRHAET